MTTQILIIGGGNAGISVAARLLNANRKLDVTIVDPSDKHYYQPAWTLVGAGDFDVKETERNEKSVIPEGAFWIQKKASKFHPEENQVELEDGSRITYDFMVVCPGIQLNWQDVKGLPETIGKNGVTSNYSFHTATYTDELFSNFKGGKALFVNPHTPVKCGGAPHKIMYMAADKFRKAGVLDKAEISYWSGAGRLFNVDKYEQTLMKVVERANIKLNFMQQLTEIDGPNRKAKFVAMDGEGKGSETWVEFDIIHVVPPQSAPDFIRQSPLAAETGWVEVDKHSLRHVRYENIFSLGDSSNLPTSKTGAAIRKQAPVVVENLLSAMKNEPLKAEYIGYTSCPLVTGYGKLVLAEFDYEGNPMETFPIDQSKERWSMYQLKKHILPWLYWNRILTGKA